MAPRAAALLPLLTVLGTTAAAAVLAQKYIPKYMENKHKKSKERKETTPTTTATTTTTTMKNETKQAPVPGLAPVAATATPQSSTIVAILLQDSYLLVSAFGACIMVVAVLVSLALVAVRDDVASLNDLQMFPPLMLVAMGMISLGMVLSMLNPKPLPELAFEDEAEKEEEQPEQADAEAIKKAAQQGQGFLYDYYKNKYGQQTTEEEGDEQEVDEDGQPKKRVSRCPFGFT